MCDNTLTGASLSGSATAVAAGDTLGDIQLKGSNGYMATNNDFTYNTSTQAINGGKIYPFYLTRVLPITLSSITATVPLNAIRITINLYDMSSVTTSFLPYLRLAPIGGGFDPTGFNGSTWGNTSGQNSPWLSGVIDGAAILNSQTQATQLWSGSIILTKIGVIGATSMYTITINMGCEYTNANVAVGCGRYLCSTTSIERVQINATPPEKFKSGFWQISCE